MHSRSCQVSLLGGAFQQGGPTLCCIAWLAPFLSRQVLIIGRLAQLACLDGSLLLFLFCQRVSACCGKAASSCSMQQRYLQRLVMSSRACKFTERHAVVSSRAWQASSTCSVPVQLWQGACGLRVSQREHRQQQQKIEHELLHICFCFFSVNQHAIYKHHCDTVKHQNQIFRVCYNEQQHQQGQCIASFEQAQKVQCWISFWKVSDTSRQ